MFGVGLMASLVTIALIWGWLLHYGVSASTVRRGLPFSAAWWRLHVSGGDRGHRDDAAGDAQPALVFGYSSNTQL